MHRMKREILVYEKDPKVLKFLRGFFKGKEEEFSVHFTKKDGDALKREILKRAPDVMVVSSPGGLMHVNPSELTCPIIAIISADLTGGLRSVVNTEVDCYLISPFHKDDFLSTLRHAVYSSSWVEIFTRERKDLQAIIELTEIISTTLNPHKVLDMIVRKIAETVRVKRCSFISIGIGDTRYAEVISSSDDLKIAKLKIDLDKYPEIRKALTLQKTVVIKDAQKDPLMKEVRALIAPVGIRSIVVIPVIFRDEVIGTMLLRTARAGHTFTKREIKLCTALASVSANVLYNAFLYERLDKEKSRLEKLAITDYLTGIYNVRYFYNRIGEEFSRAVRYQLPLSCLMLDIDHFKRINDTYGHRIGDMVLREFAQMVKKHMRKSDVLARYGGEEFIMLLPQADTKGALAEARRIKQAVTKHRFRANGAKIRIKISIGVSCFPHEKIQHYDDLIHFADNSLYKAKKNGRDQIVVHSSSA